MQWVSLQRVLCTCIIAARDKFLYLGVGFLEGGFAVTVPARISVGGGRTSGLNEEVGCAVARAGGEGVEEGGGVREIIDLGDGRLIWCGRRIFWGVC